MVDMEKEELILAAKIAMEVTGEITPILAENAKKYYDNLVKVGFTNKEAIKIVANSSVV